jgi:hypothetical protein
MTLLPLIVGSLLAAADAPALPPPAQASGLPRVVSRAEPVVERALFPMLEAGVDTAAPPPRPGLLLIGTAVAVAGVALTLPTTTRRGCALSGHCPDGSLSLLAGGLFVAGGGLAVAAGTAPRGMRLRVPTATEIRERLGLELAIGAPGERRTKLRWTPFRLQRGGGVRVGVYF